MRLTTKQPPENRALLAFLHVVTVILLLLTAATTFLLWFGQPTVKWDQAETQCLYNIAMGCHLEHLIVQISLGNSIDDPDGKMRSLLYHEAATLYESAGHAEKASILRDEAVTISPLRQHDTDVADGTALPAMVRAILEEPKGRNYHAARPKFDSMNMLPLACCPPCFALFPSALLTRHTSVTRWWSTLTSTRATTSHSRAQASRTLSARSSMRARVRG